MKIELSLSERSALETSHRRERDGRIRDRIKAVLLSNEGWSQLSIAQALRIRPETIQDHLDDYLKAQKLKPGNGGSKGSLTESQVVELIKHLESETYTKTKDICAYVMLRYGVDFTGSGMTKWLHRNHFSYKQPKKVPAKANHGEQVAFIKFYEHLLTNLPANEPLEFGDGAHPTMATKVCCGWIRTGVDKPIATTASRTRVNLMGSINLETMTVTIGEYETVNSGTMMEHFKMLRQKYPKAPSIHLVLDRGPYNTSLETKKAARKYRVVLHYLPPYSPNLNPIERLWKLMNEYVRNNRFFHSAKEFRQGILGFFQNTWPQIAMSMVDRINDNFTPVKQASSS
jgi:transposase